MSCSKFSNVKIKGISSVVPETEVNIDSEIEFYRNNKSILERNKKILGLGTRYVADDRTSNSDLCQAAAEDLIANLNIDKQKIECLIVVSSSHDYHYPASACVLQGRLDLSEDCTCFDISGLACTAYVHGLMVAHSMIEGGSCKNCLLLVGDITSRHSDKRNRNSNMLFGDAATATYLEYSDLVTDAYFYTGTRGKDWDKLIAPAGGYDLPVKSDIADLEILDASENVWKMTDDIMKGMAIFEFATKVGPAGIEKILAFSDHTVSDIDYFAIHQANKQIVKNIAMFSNIPKEKFSYKTFEIYGNCGSAAVSMDLCRQMNENHPNKIGLASFGVGLSWGFAVLDMTNTLVTPIKKFKTPAANMTREQKISYWIDYYKGTIKS